MLIIIYIISIICSELHDVRDVRSGRQNLHKHVSNHPPGKKATRTNSMSICLTRDNSMRFPTIFHQPLNERDRDRDPETASFKRINNI